MKRLNQLRNNVSRQLLRTPSFRYFDFYSVAHSSNEPDFRKFMSNAHKNINELANKIQNELPKTLDEETVANTVKEQSANFVKNVQKYIDAVSKEVKDKGPEAQKKWTEIKNKLNKAIEELNAQKSTTKENVEQLQKKFNEGVETLMKESESIAAAIDDKFREAHSISRRGVDIALEATKCLNETLKKAADQAAAAAKRKD